MNARITSVSRVLSDSLCSNIMKLSLNIFLKMKIAKCRPCSVLPKRQNVYRKINVSSENNACFSSAAQLLIAHQIIYQKSIVRSQVSIVSKPIKFLRNKSKTLSKRESQRGLKYGTLKIGLKEVRHNCNLVRLVM